MGIASEYKVPVFMDADLGHLPPAMPFVTGSMAKIEGKGGKMQISYELK